ncbi:MAG: hypothetical protein ACYSWU_22750 [Planctomycetota bacterium]|jgi:hypothetical protein
MLRANMTPKPVYNRLKQLIHTEWKTGTTGETGAAGKFTFRGFHGTYRIVAEIAGRRAESEFHLKKNGPNELTVVLPATPAR